MNVLDQLINQKMITIQDLKSHTTYELMLKVLECLNGVVHDNHVVANSVSNVTKFVQTNLSTILADWKENGTLDEIINENLFQELQTQLKNISIDVTAFGCKNDGLTDNSPVLNQLINDLSVVGSNTTFEDTQFTLVFPRGVYVIDSPITFIGSVKVECGGAIIKANRKMSYMVSFDATTPIPDVELNQLTLDGNGMAVIGLYLKDLYCAKINDVKVHSCINQCILADQSAGKSGILEFEINHGVLVGGINTNSGGHTHTMNCIGLEMRTTDCLIRNLYTRDFIVHIKNTKGVNFYDHCHGWNQYEQTMSNSVHFQCAWDVDCVGCYTDTIQKAFTFSGDARATITNHQVFINNSFYDVSRDGIPYVYDVTSPTKGNDVHFVNCRFDSNGLDCMVSPNDNHVSKVKFFHCINNGFRQGKHVVGDFKEFKTSDFTTHSPVTLWGCKCFKKDMNTVSLILQGDITKEKVMEHRITELVTLPSECYNAYYETPILVSIVDYGDSTNSIYPGVIDTNGVMKVYIKDNFTPSSNCKWMVNQSYHITY